MGGGRVALAAGLGAYVILIVWQALTLPDAVPQHLGPGGEITWGTRTGHVAGAALVGVLLVVVFGLVPRGLRHLPAAVVNLPHKEFWLAPENRPRAERMLGDDLGWMGAVMFAYCGYAFWESGVIALGSPPALARFGLLTGLTFAAIIGQALWLTLGPRWRPDHGVR